MVTSLYRLLMEPDLKKIYDELYAYCDSEDFAGYDPFDGLNSVLFQWTPLKHFAKTRLAWLQMVKRSPLNLRPVLYVPTGVNPKGLALFALAEISRFRKTEDAKHLGNARLLLDRLLETKIVGKTEDSKLTTSFGYNFDWQSRVFFAPVGTPAIVPTAFASQAFIAAYDTFNDEQYMAVASEICDFILNSLNRTIETDDEVCFSYTPVDKSVIFNASLLAGESLARVGAITGNREFLEMAAKTVRFVTRRQRSDGAWVYGSKDSQAWVDNFHTAYVLQSLHRITSSIPDLHDETNTAIKKGVNFWLNNFFLYDGTPKYYDKSIYPVDIHSSAVAIAALCELSVLDDRMLQMARKTAEWTIENMLDPEGYFYYRRRKNSVVKTPFMRWGQAWMAYALAHLIESNK
ncbi:MAG: terpene cyclase/mutase family protein [Chloracidobacterium sp.]|nr:terpene cyclase/mutase family protein [Chloracidobacterium sp.]